MPASEINNLLERYETLDLYKKASSLAFISSNQNFSASLYHLCMSILNSTKGDSQISTVRFRELVERMDEKNGYLNDPFENAFTTEILFFGGGKKIFPGYTRNAKTIIEGLLSSVFKYPKIDNKEFKAEINFLADIVFSISNELCNRFSLGSNEKVGEYKPIEIPDNINVIKDFVAFDDLELLKIFDHEFYLNIFKKNYLVDLENYKTSPDPTNDELAVKPFLKIDNQYIINDPGNLVNSLRNLILKKANEYELVHILTEGYHSYLSNLLVGSFKTLGWHRVANSLPQNNLDLRFHDFLFGFDIDKCGYVLTLEDHLLGHDFSENFGTWITVEQQNILYDRINTVADHLSSHVNEIFVVLVINSIGRATILGFEEIKHPKVSNFKVVFNGDLELFSFLEAGKELQLYKYSKLYNDFIDNTVLSNQDFLDMYWLYKSSDNSFYLGDDKKPDSLFVSFGERKHLISEFQDKYHRHVSIYYDQKSYCEVVRVDTNSEIPIYCPLTVIHNNDDIAHLVEGYQMPIWIKRDNRLKETDFPNDLVIRFIEMVSFWIWQLTNQLSRYSERLSNLICLLIEISFEDPEDWKEDEIEKIHETDRVVNVRITNKDRISLSFTKSFKALSLRQDNLSERLFIKELLVGYSELLVQNDELKSANDLKKEIENIVEIIAPKGPKKKILLLKDIRNISLDSKNLPPLRYVQKHDENILLDLVGDHISNQLEYEVGNYDGKEAVKIINHAVSFLYNHLENLLKDVDTEITLKSFISHNEKLIQSMEKERLAIPFQLECYLTEDELIENITQTSLKRNKTAVASRFVIEYLASVQPQGKRTITKTFFDEILSTASEIIGWAFMSDMIHFELIDTEISVLESGRIGTPKEKINSAREIFKPLQSKQYIKSATQNYGAYWPDNDQAITERDPEADELDKAFKDEFKITLTKLVQIYGDLIDLGIHEVKNAAKTFEKHEVINTLNQKSDHSEDEIKISIELLTLSKRESFLAPPEPYTIEDVYPWRYMRPLSYLRKPLIAFNSDDKEMFIWGTRGLIKSVSYLRDIVLTGRLQAKVNSKLLESFMGKIHRDVGKEFNSYVASKLKQQSSDLIVEEEQKKIGKRRLQKDGKDLGDIDILVISKKKKNIFVLECKDLAIARNPHEMANEIQTLIRGTSNNASTIEKHSKRTNWVKENLNYIKDFYDLKPRGNWQIFSYIVVDEEMFTPHLEKTSMEIISIDNFLTKFNKLI